MTYLYGLILTTFILLTIINLYLYWQRHVNKKRQDHPQPVAPARDKTLEELLRRLNCTYEKTEEEKGCRYQFNYQSGRFVMNLPEAQPSGILRFLFIYETETDKLNAIRNVCNHCNLHDGKLTLIYTLDEEEGKLYAHAQCEVMLTGHADVLLPHLEERLRACFSMRNHLTSMMMELEREIDRTETDDFEAENANDRREAFLHNEMEMSAQHERKLPRSNETERPTLGQMLDTLFPEETSELLQLNIVTHELRLLTETSEIKAFEVMSPLISGTGAEAKFVHHDATLILTYLRHGIKMPRTMHIALRGEGETEESLYVRLTVSIPPLSPSIKSSLLSPANKAEIYSFVTAYDRTSTEQKLAEFQYMWQDAQDKISEGKSEELTEEQAIIQHCAHPDVATNLYFGRNLMLRKRFYEALLHLENAYAVLNQHFQILHSSYQQRFYELCYYIGFCYCELGLYKLAYYYLDAAYTQNRSQYTETYLNCLANSKDFRALGLVSILLDQTEKKMQENEEEPPAELQAFYNFLRRRKAYIHIDLNNLDVAETIFKSMLDEPDNSDYALNELAYIQKLRKEKRL